MGLAGWFLVVLTAWSPPVPTLRLRPPASLAPARPIVPAPGLCLRGGCETDDLATAQPWLGLGTLAPLASGPASAASSSPLDAAFGLFAKEGYRAAGILHGLYLGNRQPPPYRDMFLMPGRAHRGLGLVEDPRGGFGVDATLYVAPRVGIGATVRVGDSSFVGLTVVGRPD